MYSLISQGTDDDYNGLIRVVKVTGHFTSFRNSKPCQNFFFFSFFFAFYRITSTIVWRSSRYNPMSLLCVCVCVSQGLRKIEMMGCLNHELDGRLPVANKSLYNDYNNGTITSYATQRLGITSNFLRWSGPLLLLLLNSGRIGRRWNIWAVIRMRTPTVYCWLPWKQSLNEDIF